MKDKSMDIKREHFETEEAYKQALQITKRMDKLSKLEEIEKQAQCNFFIAKLNVRLCAAGYDKVSAGSILANSWTKFKDSLPFKSHVNYALMLGKEPEVGDILFYDSNFMSLFEIVKISKDSCLGQVVIYKPFYLEWR